MVETNLTKILKSFWLYVIMHLYPFIHQNSLYVRWKINVEYKK